MSMSTPPPVLIIDDGELADVRQLLSQQGVGFREETGIEPAAAGAFCGLLITSARHALAPAKGGAVGAHPPCKLHVVVYDAMSHTLRRVLAQSGCDVVIPRPVHPAVLRLLVSHALYCGPERRNFGRAAMAAPVKLRVDRSPREATLVQLSLRGCGLAASEGAEIGQDVEVTFPSDLTGGEELTIRGQVLAAESSAAHAGRGQEIAVRFRSPHAVVRKILHEVMSRHALGTTAKPARRRARARAERAVETPAEECEAAASVPPERGGEAVAPDADQRSGPRKLFPRRVLAAAGGGTQVLIGRDLSAGGMRVRPAPGLALGDEFKLALYGHGDEPALVLKAVVSRDDGWDGLVLRFRDVGASAAARLERLVASLPAARGTKGRGARGPGVVVSEIVERD